MPRNFGDPGAPRISAGAYCPRCKVTCYYKPGDPHYQWCDEILIPVEDKEKARK